LDGNNWKEEYKNSSRGNDNNGNSDVFSSHASDGSLLRCIVLLMRTGGCNPGSNNRNWTKLGPVPKFTVDPADVMRKYKVVAVVGASKNPEKDAYLIPAYLRQRGYTIIPVNPTTDSIDGQKSYHSLAEIPTDLAGKVEVVDVFRPSEELPQVAEQVAQMKKRTGRPFVFWGQLGLENEEAKEILKAAGVQYVMDKCMKVEHQRLSWK
jgi:predicted CoA-binding protein